MQTRTGSSALAPAVMVHFYRGAMDLTTTWRTRIDGTTNWAVLSSGSVASFVLGDPGVSHIMALLGMFLAFAFLSIEARRYRYYDLWSGWVRIMETEYYGPLLRTNVIDAEQQWHTLLQSDLEDPHFKVTWSAAMGNRLRHNYIAIFGFLLLTWIMKLLLHPAPVRMGQTLPTIVQRAALGPVPGALVMICVLTAFAYLAGLIFFTPKLHGSGTEILSRSYMLRRLVHPSARLAGFNRARHVEPEWEGIGLAPEED